jgi:hypothetical protein
MKSIKHMSARSCQQLLLTSYSNSDCIRVTHLPPRPTRHCVKAARMLTHRTFCSHWQHGNPYCTRPASREQSLHTARSFALPSCSSIAACTPLAARLRPIPDVRPHPAHRGRSCHPWLEWKLLELVPPHPPPVVSELCTTSNQNCLHVVDNHMYKVYM